MTARDDITARYEDRWQAHRIRLGENEYPYYYGYGCIDLITRELAAFEADRFIVVTDHTVHALHGGTLLPKLATLAPVEVFSQRPGEAMKSLEQLTELMERALAAGATRRSVVIAFGGGVPGNLAGVLAGLLFRGVRLVHIPTTTLAAMDSVLSLKQAINSTRGKNHVGIYYPPAAVFTDVRVLQTLPDRELRSGLCEAAKNCLAIRPASLPALRDVLARGELSSAASLLWLLDESIRAKSSVTMHDAHEQRGGLVLEYGHTIGHAVELTLNRRRTDRPISHGEAIAFGMVAAARLAQRRGWLSDADTELHDEIVCALGAPLRLPPELAVDDLLAVLGNDNKRGYLRPASGTVPFVLLKGLGQPAGRPDLPLVPVGLDEVGSVLATLSAAKAVPV
ncbi:MAG TPA: 2-deoxy-scyllo-inosose synthase [Streptosporangiaceae bacterium]